MLTYFKQNTSEVFDAAFSDQVTSFLNVISRFLSMLKCASKEVQDRRRFHLARGLPDLISAAGKAKVNDMKLAGVKSDMMSTFKRNTTLPSMAKTRTNSAESLSLSGVKGTWKEQLQM